MIKSLRGAIMQKDKKGIYFLVILLLLFVLSVVAVVVVSCNRGSSYTTDNIPRRYIIGDILAIDEDGKSIELLYGDEHASVTLNKSLVIYDANLKEIKISDLKAGQQIQCDIQLSVTSEKINSFHDCRQIFVLP